MRRVMRRAGQALLWTVLAGLCAGAAGAADLSPPQQYGRFRATCEDLGGLCFADACGRDQIAAAQNCRAVCPSAVVMDVLPGACPLPGAPPAVVLRRRG